MTRRSPLHESSSARPVATTAVLFVIVVLAGLFVPLPKFSRLAGAGIDLVHAPLFAALTWLVARRARPALGPRAAVAVTLTSVVLVAILSELVQGFVGRSPSVQDIAANLLGIAAGFCLARPAPRPAALGAAAALAIAAASAMPLAIAGDALRQARQMPLVASFEDRLEFTRWKTQQASMVRDSRFATHGNHAVRVVFSVAEYPGITLSGPPPNWKPYERLVFDISAERGQAAPLILKITDAAHNDQPWDRFHRRIVIGPGTRRVTIPLTEVSAAPRDRELDLTRVAAVQFFAANPEVPLVFYLDGVRLE